MQCALQMSLMLSIALAWCTPSHAQLPDRRDLVDDEKISESVRRLGDGAIKLRAQTRPQVQARSDNSSDKPPVVARQTLGKPFWVWWAVLGSLAVADNELTAQCVHNSNCSELNPILGRKPTRLELYGVKVSLLGALCYFSSRRKIQGKTDWKLPLMVGIPVYGAAAISNAIQLSRIRSIP
jgi:hypothetical protein